MFGATDPYSMAEAIIGERIDWSKTEDEFDTIAECFGITKEGFLSNENPLMSPLCDFNEAGDITQLSKEDVEERITAFMKKYARPEKENNASSQEKIMNGLGMERAQKMTMAERRQYVKNILLQKYSDR